MDLLMLIEQVIIYSIAFLLCAGIVAIYLRKMQLMSQKTQAKIEKAKEEGLFEPVSLHPVINPDMCINSGACMAACPEKDILGIQNGRATLINASLCVGHGACFHACPVEAITLVIGTEKRGVDLPHVNQEFESNIPGIFIAGELGGMGLIKNSVEQGNQAIQNIIKAGIKKDAKTLDLIIIGAGPAGISASLTAKKHGLNFVTLEQDSLGGTVFTFPRSKVVMTSPMELPLYGRVKLTDTSKSELLAIWQDVLKKNEIKIQEFTKVEEIRHSEFETFEVLTNRGDLLKTKTILLAIGRRGSPRKLNVPGEVQEKVAYRLLEPERIIGKKVLVVGGGDSAVEAAMSLMDQNEVVISYRQDTFARIKVKNRDKILEAIADAKLNVMFSSNVAEIKPDTVLIKDASSQDLLLPNDLVYIFAGGELPTQFLEKAGIMITKRFGYTMRKHG
jgi:thioredoxin reductase (NADPH)